MILTIGNFDGVHLGHVELVKRTLELAREKKLRAVALTFNPHPRAVLNIGVALELLLTYAEKIEHLKKLGFNEVIEQQFVREFSNLSAREFFQNYLINKFKMSGLVVGYDFAFGKDRDGSKQVLASLCAENKILLVTVPAFEKEGAVISSSKIRKALIESDLKAANQLLGYTFYYQGVVVKGEQRGRKIGFPTANLPLRDKIKIPYGVYATRSIIKDSIFPSVTNIGVRPTFNGLESTVEATIETHLINQDIDLYGTNIRVEFLGKIRDEKKFSGIEELKAQIKNDVTSALRLIESNH
ncbi:MAG: bifunctional riboflavin kinase/FAD synthetase [Xanthomonadaceae bacterium]|nr:bifunctional riboflavin kinase/FAD synthetase [Xanthomonadaceae bacterium]